MHTYVHTLTLTRKKAKHFARQTDLTQLSDSPYVRSCDHVRVAHAHKLQPYNSNVQAVKQRVNRFAQTAAVT